MDRTASIVAAFLGLLIAFGISEYQLHKKTELAAKLKDDNKYLAAVISNLIANPPPCPKYDYRTALNE